MADHLDSKSLVPFKKRGSGYQLPGMESTQEKQLIEQVDPDLRPDEQGYVRHYLSYADTMLNSSRNEGAQKKEGPAAPQDLNSRQNETTPDVKSDIPAQEINAPIPQEVLTPEVKIPDPEKAESHNPPDDRAA